MSRYQINATRPTKNNKSQKIPPNGTDVIELSDVDYDVFKTSNHKQRRPSSYFDVTPTTTTTQELSSSEVDDPESL